MLESSLQVSRGRLSVLKLLTQFVALSCLATSTIAGEQESPKVGQNTDEYEEYRPDTIPFSETEKYQFFNSFIIGFKLSDTYD